jgi:hypothetical protein
VYGKHSLFSIAKWSSLELKTRPKQLRGYLSLDIVFLGEGNLKVVWAVLRTLEVTVCNSSTYSAV